MAVFSLTALAYEAYKPWNFVTATRDYFARDHVHAHVDHTVVEHQVTTFAQVLFGT